jgi:hypothetical protein
MHLSRVIAVFAIILLFVLHNNWWSWEPDSRLLFGIPFDLIYRIFWVLLSTGALWLVLRISWREPE